MSGVGRLRLAVQRLLQGHKRLRGHLRRQRGHKGRPRNDSGDVFDRRGVAIAEVKGQEGRPPGKPGL